MLKTSFNNVIGLLESFLVYNKRSICTDIIPDIHLSLSLAYYNIGEYPLSLALVCNRASLLPSGESDRRQSQRGTVKPVAY